MLLSVCDILLVFSSQHVEHVWESSQRDFQTPGVPTGFWNSDVDAMASEAVSAVLTTKNR